MKKTLWLIFLSLCVFLFFACGSQSETSDTSDGTVGVPTVTENVFPDAPPNLTVTSGEEQIIAWRGTYSWERVNSLGIGQAVCADSMHPLDAARDFSEEFPVLKAKDGDSMQLHFEVQPNQMTVRYYPDGWDSYDPVSSHYYYTSKIEVRTGLYEIVAEWNSTAENYSGEVHYAFRVYHPWRVISIAYETVSENPPALSSEMIYEDAEYRYYLLEAENGSEAVTYANGEVWRIKDALAAGHITLTDLAWQHIYYVLISKVLPEPTDSDVLYIIDRSEGNPFPDANETFFEDDDYIYYFGNPIIGCVTVVYRDGRSENVRDALVNGSISISDLDRFGIRYYKDAKRRSNVP